MEASSFELPRLTRQERAYIIAKQYAFLFARRPFPQFKMALDIAHESAPGHVILYDDDMYFRVRCELKAYNITLGLFESKPGFIVLCESEMDHVGVRLIEPCTFVA